MIIINFKSFESTPVYREYRPIKGFKAGEFRSCFNSHYNKISNPWLNSQPLWPGFEPGPSLLFTANKRCYLFGLLSTLCGPQITYFRVLNCNNYLTSWRQPPYHIYTFHNTFLTCVSFFTILRVHSHPYNYYLANIFYFFALLPIIPLSLPKA